MPVARLADLCTRLYTTVSHLVPMFRAAPMSSSIRDHIIARGMLGQFTAVDSIVIQASLVGGAQLFLLMVDQQPEWEMLYVVQATL